MADLCQKYAAKFFVEIEYITTENKIFSLTIVSTTVDFNSHTDGSLMRTVGMKSDLGGENDRVEVLLDCDVGICVAVHDLTVLNVAVPHPLVQAGPEVLQHIILRKLRTLTIAKPAHGLCGRHCVDSVQIYFNPLGSILPNHVPGTPGPSVLIKSDPGNDKYFIIFLKTIQ